jgi:G3E family GTPase
VQEEQIRYADLILLNKTDRIDPSARLKVEAALREINPSAKVITTRHGQVEPELLSDGGATRAQPTPCGHEHCDHEHDHAHHEHDLPHAASSLFLPLNAPVERTVFERFLAALPTSVFRAKGFIRLAESPQQLHTFQQVRDQTELLLLPLDGGAEIATGLVFIGPHLDKPGIRELAKGLLAVPVAG